MASPGASLQFGFREPLRSGRAVEQHAWEQEPQLPRAFGFAGLRRRLQDVGEGKLHGMSERPFDRGFW